MKPKLILFYISLWSVVTVFSDCCEMDMSLNSKRGFPSLAGISTVQGATAPDISIDCDFSDWTNGQGTEFVADDEEGDNDWKSPAKYDITRFGVASDLNDSLYFLFGFDEIDPGKTTAAVLIDTDLDDNINMALSVTIINSDILVELFACDNTLPGGCGAQSLTKVINPGIYCAGTASGPWNTDTFVEVDVAFSELAEFGGGAIVLNSLVSALKDELNIPKDYLHLNSDTRILYDTETGEGVIIDGPGTPFFRGRVFTDEGTTSAGAGKSVTILKNGSVMATALTEATGSYLMAFPASIGDTLLVFIDNDSALQGTSVSVFGGTSLADFDIYADHCVTRHDNGGTLTNASMATAKGGASDSDILYAVSGGTELMVTGPSTELFIPSAHSFTPGGGLTTTHMKNLGTFTGGSAPLDINGTLTLAGGSFTATSGPLNLEGDFTHAAGTFDRNSGTIIFDGTGQAISGSTTFYGLTKTASVTDTLTFQSGTTQTIAGPLILEGAAGHYLNLRSSSAGTTWNLNLGPAATKSISLVDVMDSDASGSDAPHKPINPRNSVDSGNTVDWFPVMPDILMVKSVQAFSDPCNGVTNPKAIPGAVMLYTVAATNHGDGPTDADSVVITDPIPENTVLFVGDINGVGSGPVQFMDGAMPSGLSYAFTGLGSMTDDAEFSNDGGDSYLYVPSPDATGFDSNITHMRIHPRGAFNAAVGGAIPGFQLRFKVRVQ